VPSGIRNWKISIQIFLSIIEIIVPTSTDSIIAYTYSVYSFLNETFVVKTNNLLYLYLK